MKHLNIINNLLAETNKDILEQQKSIDLLAKSNNYWEEMIDMIEDINLDKDFKQLLEWVKESIKNII